MCLWILVTASATFVFLLVWFIVAGATCSLCQWTAMRHFSYHVRYSWITRFAWFTILGKTRWPD